jgi:peptidoglycan/xylan/chitin deacetylase (PgdA/CDA1 family)
MQPVTAPTTVASLRANRAVELLDYLRVPYEVDQGTGGSGDLTWIETGAARMCWPRFSADRPAGAWHLDDVRLFGRLLDDDAAERALGPGWSAATAVHDGDGVARAHVRRGPDGSSFLPFDPDEVVHLIRSESYLGLTTSPLASGSTRLARSFYYRVRPILPRSVQIAMRRGFTSVQQRSTFPRWPIETSLHDVLDLVLGLLGEAAGEPIPWIAPWPTGYDSAVVLTHDVEQQLGHDNIHLLRDIELEHGFRSSWNLVPRRYDVGDETVAALADAGFEVGVHGLYHDGRDLESEKMLRRRLPEMREWAERWHAVGFRSPATHRTWELMPLLHFDYDSSYPDTDPYEPVGGGCCSWLPFMNDDLVELPITLPQDHTLYEILRAPAAAHWCAKADAVADRGGMALLITHPDYMLDAARLDDYRAFLAHTAERAGVWRALPRDVSAWWRRRGTSSVVRHEDRWAVTGPAAADAAVVFGPLGAWRP